MAAGPRREARERALLVLYEAEMKSISPSEVIGESPVPPDPFTVQLVSGVTEQQASLDRLIGEVADDWPVERLAVVDRNILRLAGYELGSHLDTPAAVVISEAVELAKRYSTEQSGRFVNGVLATITRRLRPSSPLL